MRTPRLLIALSAGALVTTALTSTAVAGATPEQAPPAPRAASAWTKVSTGTVDSLSEVTAARTSDGVLHLVYATEVGTDAAYQRTSLSTTGAVVGRGSVLGGPWASLVHNPQLLRTGDDDLRLVFSGLQDTDTSNFFSDGRMYEATSDASAASWTLEPRALTKVKVAYAGYGTGATTLLDGTPVSATQLNSEIYHRVGSIDSTDDGVLEAAPDDGSFTLPGCCGYEAQLVNAGDDTVWLAWYANGSTPAGNGTFVRQIHPTVGEVMKVPGSSVGASSLDPGQRVAMTARADGSVWLAYLSGYPVSTGVGLWRVGAPKATVVRAARGASRVALDANPSGRMWLAWTVGSSERPAYALRTSATGLRLGAVQRLGAVKGSEAVFALTVDASLAQATVLATADEAVWAQLVKPGLSLGASPRSWRPGQRTRVTFTAEDAGDPVAGVRVSGGGESCRTNAAGTCRVTYGPRPAGTVKATGRKAGYGSAKVVLRVR